SRSASAFASIATAVTLNTVVSVGVTLPFWGLFAGAGSWVRSCTVLSCGAMTTDAASPSERVLTGHLSVPQWTPLAPGVSLGFAVGSNGSSPDCVAEVADGPRSVGVADCELRLALPD